MNDSRPIHGIVLASAALTLAAAVFAASGPSAPGAAFGGWLLVCLAGERLWVRLRLGEATMSMASASHFAAILLLPRSEAMLAAGIASFAAEVLFMRKPLTRAAFNSGQVALAVAAASSVAHSHVLAGSSPALAFSWPALVLLPAAAATYTLVNTGAVAIAVASSERVSPWRAWSVNFGTAYECLSNATVFALGAAMAVLTLRIGVAGTLAGMLPLLLTHASYRRHLAHDAGRPEAPARRSDRRAA